MNLFCAFIDWIIKFEDNPLELVSIRKTIILLLLVITCVRAFNQTKSAQVSNYSFQHISPSQGLASHVVNRVFQDEQGYMWIATINGLQRFDGNRFLTFQHEEGNPQSLPNNHITNLYEDRDKNLWIASALGHVGIFDKKKFVYTPISIKVKEENSLRAQKYFSQDNEGNIFIHLIPHEFLTYNKKTNEFSSANTFVTFPPKWRVWSVDYEEKDGLFYIAGDSGLAIFNPATRKLNYAGQNTENHEVINALSHIRFASQLRVDSKHRMWFITWSVITGEGPYVYCYDLKKGKLIFDQLSLYYFLNSYHETSPIFQQKTGKLWLYGLPFLAEFDDTSKQFIPVPNKIVHEQSINFEKVNALFEDREENLWVSTSDNGIFLFNPSEQLFNSIQHTNRFTNTPGNEAAISFVETDNRQLLVGVWAEGIYRYDSNMNNIPVNIKGIPEKNGHSAWCMKRMMNGEIWMGLQGGHIVVYNQQTGSSKMYTPPVIQERTIRQLAQDKFGNVWMGTHSIGLYKWSASHPGKTFEDKVIPIPGIPRTLIPKLMVDSKGYLWVCTIVDGIYKIDPKTDNIIEHITSKDPPTRRLIDNSVADVLEYNDSTILIVSSGLNVYNTKRNTITHVTTEHGLPMPYINSIEKDKRGNLWLGMVNGLCRYDLRTRNFSMYDRTDGIRNDKFKIAASYLMRDGRLLFGTSNDFVVFNPDKVKSSSNLPTVVITDIKLGATSLLVDSIQKLPELKLRYDDKSITIDFASLSYVKKNKLTYYYKLEGIDKDWILADMTQRAVYTYLPTGNYTFMLKAQNVDGAFSNQVTSLKIKMNPPFWKTWWFLGLVIIAGVIFLYWLDQQRMNRLRATESIRTRIATSLTEDMTNSISSINISSELAKTKVDKDVERTKEYISQISDTSNRMVQAMYDMVWSIQPDNDTMQHTIDRMKSFAAEIEATHHTDIVFDIGKSVSKLELDMEFRYELLSIYKEAITNAAKHADARHIQVMLDCRKRLLRLSIEDDGEGFDLESVVMGRGINDMRRRASAINATLKIKSYINTGTIIKVETKI